MPSTEAQKRAAKKWRENNYEKWRIIRKNASNKWKENNYERWHEYHNAGARKSAYRCRHWKLIKIEFLNILLD